MPASSELEKQLKKAAKTGKYVVGRKEVLASLKGSKLLVWSASANIPLEILNQCKTFQIPALRYDGDPIALGKTCGIPFKVSVIAVKSAGDADLNSLSGSQDYTIPVSGLLTRIPVSNAEVEPEQPEEQTGKKEAKEAKKVKVDEPKEEKPKKTARVSKSSDEKKTKLTQKSEASS